MNIDKLKGKLVEKKKTYEDCAKALNVSITTFSNKMNGRGSLYIEEVNTLSNYLELSNEEKIEIFLIWYLHNIQVRERSW